MFREHQPAGRIVHAHHGFAARVVETARDDAAILRSALARIGIEQAEAAERGLHRATHGVVKAHGLHVGWGGCERGARFRIDEATGDRLHDDATGAGKQAPVAQGLDDQRSIRMSCRNEDLDGAGGVGIAVRCQPLKSFIGGLRDRRDRGRDQRDEDDERMLQAVEDRHRSGSLVGW